MTQLNRRSQIKRLLGLGTLGAGGTIGVIRHVLAQGAKPVPPGVQALKGEVLIDGKPARRGQPVLPGATVSTRAGAEVVYVIEQDAFLQRENTVVRFGVEAGKEFFRILSGKLLSVFGPGHKTLHTPTASLGIRGTGCYIEAQPASVYFCLCYGSVEIVPLASPAKARQLETRHHDHPLRINLDPAMPTMEDATVINHSDAELILLENLTGRWPPFYGTSERSY